MIPTELPSSREAFSKLQSWALEDEYATSGSGSSHSYLLVERFNPSGEWCLVRECGKAAPKHSPLKFMGQRCASTLLFFVHRRHCIAHVSAMQQKKAMKMYVYVPCSIKANLLLINSSARSIPLRHQQGRRTCMMIVTVPQIGNHVHQITQWPPPPHPQSHATSERHLWTHCRRWRTYLWRPP